jgi:hypothetical protein
MEVLMKVQILFNILLIALIEQKSTVVTALIKKSNIKISSICNSRGNSIQRKSSSTILCDSSLNPPADIAKTEKTYSPFTNGRYTTVTLYQLTCKDEKKRKKNTVGVFIGYTSIKLETAIKNHKTLYQNPNSKSHDNPLYKLIRANGGWDNWDYHALEICPSIDRKEALTKQRDWIQQTPNAINQRRPITTYEEDATYYKDNRAVLLEQKKIHRNSHKELISERMKVYREDHKNAIAEQRKAYYEANKVAICAQKRKASEAKRLLKLMALKESDQIGQ